MPRTKKLLRARDIERLENTSFASVVAGGLHVGAPDLDVSGVTACSCSCEGACTCGGCSEVCCITITMVTCWPQCQTEGGMLLR